MLWLPRYFYYSIEAKRIEFTGTGSDKSFIGMFMCVLTVLQSFKESKENITKGAENKEVKNIEEMVFVVFEIIYKTK